MYKNNEIFDNLMELEQEDFNQAETTIGEIQNDILQRIHNQNVLDNEINDSILDPKSDTFISIIKNNVNFCINELKDVNETMGKISSQKSTELFFRKSENIKLLSQYMSKVASVNQKTLDLLILLLGAGSKISENYDTILSTIEELGTLNNGEAEVLNYLLKVKKMVSEIHDNDLKMKQVLEESNSAKEVVENSIVKLTKEINESEKSRKTIESKCIKLQKQLKFNNLYIGICLLLIITLSIFVGVKFHVF